jgi:hypothetical protein
MVIARLRFKSGPLVAWYHKVESSRSDHVSCYGGVTNCNLEDVGGVVPRQDYAQQVVYEVGSIWLEDARRGEP